MRALLVGMMGKAFPLYLSMLSSLAGSLVVAAVLGRAHTTELAAHALVLALLAPMLLAGQGALQGMMPFVARAEDDPGTLGEVVRAGTWLSLSLGALFALVMAAVPILARPLGVDGETLAALGIVYPFLVALHAFVASLSASATTLLVAMGCTRAVLALSLVETVLVLGLAPVLVLGAGPVPALGLLGAGIALAACGAVALLVKVLVVRRLLPPRARGWIGAPRWRRVGEIARVGLPTGATLLVKSAVLSVLAVATARIGAPEAAAHQFLVLLANLLFFPALAVGRSSIPAVAAAAEGDPVAARRVVLAGYVLALPVTLAALASVWALKGPIVGTLSPDPVVGATMVAVFPLLCWVAAADNVQVVSGMGLVALRRTMPSLYVFAFCYGALVCAAFPLAGLGGPVLVWAGYAVAVTGLALGQTVALWRATSGRG
ncbi:MATE family efflux transporter [Nocardiopsis alba]|uniref:MATE family efflux transporter n=1 Tax=Nocardiopsis alba TaxID=53437 RepID=UPI0033B6DCBB